MNIEIRHYEAKDKAVVLFLHKKGLEQTESFIQNSDLDKDLEDIEGVYLKNGGEFLVLTVDGKVVGMGALRRVDHHTAEIKRMRVSAEFQGRGFGSALLDKLIHAAKNMGYKDLILDTSKKQTTAQKLYKKFGFQEMSRGKIANLSAIYYRLALE